MQAGNHDTTQMHKANVDQRKKTVVVVDYVLVGRTIPTSIRPARPSPRHSLHTQYKARSQFNRSANAQETAAPRAANPVCTSSRRVIAYIPPLKEILCLPKHILFYSTPTTPLTTCQLQASAQSRPQAQDCPRCDAWHPASPPLWDQLCAYRVNKEPD